MRIQHIFNGLKSVCAFALLLNAAALASARTVDNFDGDVLQQQLETTAMESVTGSFFNAGTPGLTIVGDARDAILTQTSSSSSARTTVNEGAMTGVYDLSFRTLVTGKGQLQYDGNDGSMDLDPEGLGGINFKEDDHSTLYVHVPFNDHETQMKITVWTDADNISEFTATIPVVAMGNPTHVESVAFADFMQQAGASGPADFSDVGALQFDIDGDIGGMGGLDLWLDLIETGASAVPEPSSGVSLLLGGLVLVSCGSYRARRKRAALR